MSWFKVLDVAASAMGRASPKMATTMTRLRPRASAMSPMIGAVNATAKVVAVTVILTAPTDAEKACANKGSKGCVT